MGRTLGLLITGICTKCKRDQVTTLPTLISQFTLNLLVDVQNKLSFLPQDPALQTPPGAPGAFTRHVS